MSICSIVAPTFSIATTVQKRFSHLFNLRPLIVTPETGSLRGLRNCLIVIVNNAYVKDLQTLHESNIVVHYKF